MKNLLTRNLYFFLLAFLAYGIQNPGSGWSEQPSPVYVSLLNSPHDFDLFATSGWDGNWYVGFNSMWIAELTPPADGGRFMRVLIGAKLGRMKSQTVPGKPPWIRQPLPCELYIGISATSAWKSSDSYFLVNCEDLPLEGSPEDALHGVGESRWFWKEVPAGKINFGGPNYLGIWSTTPELFNASSGPILAAGMMKGSAKAWLNRGIRGSPPLMPEDGLETNVNEFVPALAIKFIPEHDTSTIKIDLVGFREAADSYQWDVQVLGRNVERVQPEISLDKEKWFAFGRAAFDPPYQIKASRDRIQREVENLVPGNRKPGQAYIRVTAWDEWSDSSSTEVFLVYIR